MEGAQDISEHETNVAGQVVGDDGGESGKCIVGADGPAGNGAIDEDKNFGDVIGMLLDLSRDTLLVELVLLNTTGVGQSRCVEDADL